MQNLNEAKHNKICLHLILTTNPERTYYSHSTDQETEAPEDSNLLPALRVVNVGAEIQSQLR